MQFNERKLETLRYFARRQWTRPAEWAAGVGFYPIRASYSYLKHLQRWGLLLRGRDVTGRIVYKLSPRGATWLLKRERAV
jgi:hypothetical protein